MVRDLSQATEVEEQGRISRHTVERFLSANNVETNTTKDEAGKILHGLLHGIGDCLYGAPNQANAESSLLNEKNLTLLN